MIMCSSSAPRQAAVEVITPHRLAAVACENFVLQLQHKDKQLPGRRALSQHRRLHQAGLLLLLRCMINVVSIPGKVMHQASKGPWQMKAQC